MILLSRLQTVAYRIHVPKWAYAPTSGSGAAEHGGRLNRPGVPALYLALDESTALAEYKQLSRLLPPGLLVSYEIQMHHIVDFRDGYASNWDPLWQELYCDWRRLWFNERIEPPSWLLGDMVLETQSSGILFPSQINPGGTNLALFTEAVSEGDILKVYDPDGRLPRDASAWE